jgi:hypothetical protein
LDELREKESEASCFPLLFEKRLMRNELIKLLSSRYQKLKSYQVTDSVSSYVNAVMQEIALQFASITSEDFEADEC